MVEKTFELPDLGEGIAEGELVSWTVELGDSVDQDQVIAEVETDKALVEIPSPYDGTITSLHAEEGEIIPVDSNIVTFEVAEDEIEGEHAIESEDEETVEAESAELETAAEGVSSEASSGNRVFASPSTRQLARDLEVELESVSGSGPGGRITDADVRQAAESDGTGAATANEKSTADTGEPVLVESEGASRDRTLAMPATRRLAREQGVDINNIPASEEREGEAFVTPEDVEAYIESGGATAAKETAATETTTATGKQEEAGKGGTASGERVPYRGIRRTIGEQMAKSKFTAPHVSHHDEFDATELVDLRAELAEIAEKDDVNLTYLPFVVKAVTSALQEVPYLNASLNEEADEIILHDEYNIGIAVATDDGLMVPVIKHADRKGLKELAAEINDLAKRARNRDLEREEMSGGTFTITNIGVIGGEYSSPIINYPEAGILAMGPIEKRPWVVDDEVVARETMTLSMSVDHRLVDGAEAAQFTNHIQKLLADPTRLILE